MMQCLCRKSIWCARRQTLWLSNNQWGIAIMQQCIDSGKLIACETTNPDRWERDLGLSVVATATRDLVSPTHSQVSSGHASSPPPHRKTLLCIVKLTHSSNILPTLHCSVSTSSTQYSTCVHTIQYLCTHTAALWVTADSVQYLL